jgi:hypothetical protein
MTTNLLVGIPSGGGIRGNIAVAVFIAMIVIGYPFYFVYVVLRLIMGVAFVCALKVRAMWRGMGAQPEGKTE